MQIRINVNDQDVRVLEHLVIQLAGALADASNQELPHPPRLNSPSNQRTYQPRFDELYDLASRGQWDAVRRFPILGSNSYNGMLQRYRDQLLEHAGPQQDASSATDGEPVRADRLTAAEVRRHGERWRIRRLRTSNPRRSGTRGHANWILYRDNMTVAEFWRIPGDTRLDHLRWDVNHGFVEIIPEEPAPA